MRRLAGAVLLCLCVAACGSEQDVAEPTATPAQRSVAALADVLEVRCQADGSTVVSAAQVRPGRAGVRTRVVNETDGARAVALHADRLWFTASQGPGTTTESAEGVRPGTLDVECIVPDSSAAPGASARVEIVDPDGLWRPATPECPASDIVAVPGETGWTALPFSREGLPDMLRSQAHLASSDVVRPGGYPEQADAPLVALRDGRVIVSATPQELDGGGGWWLSEVWGCGSAELVPSRVAEETPPVVESVEVASPLPEVLDVRCTAAGTTTSAPAVKPGPAGVRVRVVNETDTSLNVTLKTESSGSGGEVSGGAERETVEPLAPGSVDVACYDPTDPAQDPPSSPGYLERVASFDVVDQDGLWVADTPECPDDHFVGVAGSFTPDAGMPREDLPDAIRERAHLAPDDEVRAAGYPEQANAPLVVVRDGRVVVSATPIELEQGWEIGGMQGCAADGLIG